jgi:hypothetical protein
MIYFAELREVQGACEAVLRCSLSSRFPEAVANILVASLQPSSLKTSNLYGESIIIYFAELTEAQGACEAVLHCSLSSRFPEAVAHILAAKSAAFLTQNLKHQGGSSMRPFIIAYYCRIYCFL